ncbi:MAG TPA: tetratricopeptide repeat protein [Candidatus Sulfotelmatobacter sp.]|nr:tetratricopeptide repeat protein [Candidatus Sulfotelmatobacter sp.]
MQPASGKQLWCICIALAVGTLALYWPTTHDAFINFDDNAYVTDNPHIKAGLTWSGIVWAFKSGYAANWHPLTWISHMLDYQLFGLNPGAHHLMNVLFHTANTLLLFILLNYMTGAMWRSAFVAALFAWHPLHVESVAWASERKDVLSAFFWMLTLLCYAHYARGQGESSSSSSSLAAPKPGEGGFSKNDPAVHDGCGANRSSILHPLSSPFYYLALFFFACGLMSKPMVVTLPFVLLLLDFWPLQRFNASTLQRVIVEKLPFLALSFLACAVTYLVQRHGGAVVVNDPLSIRVSNAMWAYDRYISKTFWPTDLSIVYPYVRDGLATLGIASGLLLAATSIVIIALARRRPYLFMGWFWFLGTLVPVIGFVEIGPASMADRYTYLPDIGLFILVTWVVADLLQDHSVPGPLKRVYPARDITILLRSQPVLSVIAAGIVLDICIGLTFFQIKYWRNSVTLFNHAIRVTTDNAVACACLGQALDVAGDDTNALKYCREAVRIDPHYPAGQFFLGQVLWNLGYPSEALTHLTTAAQTAPDNSGFQYNLGKFLLEHGRIDDAIARFQAAIKDDPEFPEAHNALGKAYLKQGYLQKAADELARAVALDPGNPQFHYDLGTVLLSGSQPAEAIKQFSEAVRFKPDFATAHANLAVALANEGKLADAIPEFVRAVQLQPNDAEARFNLGFAYLNNRQPGKAADQFLQELRLTPNESKAHYRLAEALREQNEWSQAVTEYRKTLELSPNFADAKKEQDEILAAHPQLR